MATLQSAGVSPALAEHYVKAVRQGETLELILVEDKNADRVVEIMRRHAALYSAADTGEGSASAADTSTNLRPDVRERAGIPERQGTRNEPAATMASPTVGPGPAKTGVAGTIERAKEAISEKLGGGNGAKQRDLAEDRVIPILREEIQVGKREVERGSVHVGVYVTERPVSEHVLLREEHVEIERRPMDREPRADELEFRTGEIDMTERSEEAVVSKQVRVVEEVRLHKRVTERDETINDKLRSTQVDVDDVAGERNAYVSHYASLGNKGSFEEARPAYEYGRQLRRTGGERWEDIEPNARTSWEAQHPGTWQRFQDAIRYAFSRDRKR